MGAQGSRGGEHGQGCSEGLATHWVGKRIVRDLGIDVRVDVHPCERRVIPSAEEGEKAMA